MQRGKAAPTWREKQLSNLCCRTELSGGWEGVEYGEWKLRPVVGTVGTCLARDVYSGRLIKNFDSSWMAESIFQREGRRKKRDAAPAGSPSPNSRFPISTSQYLVQKTLCTLRRSSISPQKRARRRKKFRKINK